MLYESGNLESNATAAELERMRRDTLCPSERADAISYDWARIGFGIVLAGGAYPVVVAVIVLAFMLVIALLNTPSIGGVDDGAEVVIAFGAGTFFAAFGGILWSGMVTTLTLPIVYVVAWSLSLHTSIVGIGAFAGGLVGFICVLPLTLSVPWLDFGGDFWEVVATASLGPMLATILGQLGGAWGGSKSRELGPARSWQYNTRLVLWNSPASEPMDAGEAVRQRLQFGVRHLPWISVWLSLLLALIRVSGIPYELFLPLLLAWLLFQLATIWIGGKLLPRLAQWRERRRQFRST